MRPGPKSITGLGGPLSLRGSLAALSKGGGGLPPGARFVTYLGQRVTYAAAPVYTRGY